MHFRFLIFLFWSVFMPCKQRAGIRVNRKIIVDIVRNIGLQTHKLNDFVCGHLFETPWHEKTMFFSFGLFKHDKASKRKKTMINPVMSQNARIFCLGSGRDMVPSWEPKRWPICCGQKWPQLAASGRAWLQVAGRGRSNSKC